MVVERKLFLEVGLRFCRGGEGCFAEHFSYPVTLMTEGGLWRHDGKYLLCEGSIAAVCAFAVVC